MLTIVITNDLYLYLHNKISMVPSIPQFHKHRLVTIILLKVKLFFSFSFTLFLSVAIAPYFTTIECYIYVFMNIYLINTIMLNSVTLTSGRISTKCLLIMMVTHLNGWKLMMDTVGIGGNCWK